MGPGSVHVGPRKGAPAGTWSRPRVARPRPPSGSWQTGPDAPPGPGWRRALGGV